MSVYRHYEQRQFNAVWAGAVTKPRVREWTYKWHSQAPSPEGSKLLIVNNVYVELAWWYFQRTSTAMSVDGVMQIMVAGGNIVVMEKLLAGSQTHWSACESKYVGSHAANLPLLGELLYLPNHVAPRW